MLYLTSLILISVFGIVSGLNFSEWVDDQDKTNNLVFGITAFVLGILSSLLMLI